jgi:hypothetical protein
MPSLEILEGLIGTACAVACLYYARLGALAGPQNSMPVAAPWHNALGEYARRNPFALVFGALALGFLISSWSMYALPRPAAIAPRTIEKWRTITKNVPAPDPAQAAKIAALQTAVNADTATIAAQTAEIDRLKQLLVKSPHHSRQPAIVNPKGATADLNRTFNPGNTTGGATVPAGAPASSPGQSPATNGPPTQNPAAAPPNGASQDSTTTPPH